MTMSRERSLTTSRSSSARARSVSSAAPSVNPVRPQTAEALQQGRMPTRGRRQLAHWRGQDGGLEAGAQVLGLSLGASPSGAWAI